jgi:hypothetical protein
MEADDAFALATHGTKQSEPETGCSTQPTVPLRRIKQTSDVIERGTINQELQLVDRNLQASSMAFLSDDGWQISEIQLGRYSNEYLTCNEGVSRVGQRGPSDFDSVGPC